MKATWINVTIWPRTLPDGVKGINHLKMGDRVVAVLVRWSGEGGKQWRLYMPEIANFTDVANLPSGTRFWTVLAANVEQAKLRATSLLALHWQEQATRRHPPPRPS